MEAGNSLSQECSLGYYPQSWGEGRFFSLKQAPKSKEKKSENPACSPGKNCQCGGGIYM